MMSLSARFNETITWLPLSANPQFPLSPPRVTTADFLQTIMTQGNVDVLCRADGKPMTQDDHDALFEFGAYHMFFRFFMLSLGMEVTKAAEPNVPSTPVPVSEKCLTANIERADGRRVTLEDENALLEFGQFFMVFQVIGLRKIEPASHSNHGHQLRWQVGGYLRGWICCY